MKNLLKSALFVAAIVLISSCGGRVSDYRDILPADAFMTVSFNPATLAGKSGAENFEQSALFARVRAEFENREELPAEQREFILDLLKNPKESGIDVNHDSYLFMSVKSIDAADFGLLFPIADKGKFDTFIKGFQPTTEGRLSVLNIDKAVLVYNDNAVVLYFSTSSPASQEFVKGLFAQRRDASLMGNEAAAAQLLEKNDINIVMNFGAVTPVLKSNPLTGSMPAMEALAGVMMLSSVNFEQGQILAKGVFHYADKQSEEKMAETFGSIKEQSASLFGFIPAGGVGALSFGIDGAKLVNQSASMSGYGALVANPLVRQVLSSLDGDLAVVFAGMFDNGYPDASLLAEVNDSAVVDKIVAQFPNFPIKKNPRGGYQFNIGGMSILFGVKNNILYITTEPRVVMALGGAKIDSFSSVMDKLANGSEGSLYLDLRSIHRLIKKFNPGIESRPDMAAAMSFLALFDRLEASTSMPEWNMVVYMADSEQNALKTICNIKCKK